MLVVERKSNGISLAAVSGDGIGARMVASEVERGRLATKAVVVRQIRSGGVGGWAQGRLGEMELRRHKVSDKWWMKTSVIIGEERMTGMV
ncbi:hypothetical protein L2E82_12209 [Cichorium intybus]|uniref:Uncharacterized protein n=1 Tax=Cichorium intybus TaxID=13427 RepID=A0ACB9GFH5_CICIN|nr:hypothetical protein L2E82_12209 [Cichorium intybus]